MKKNLNGTKKLTLALIYGGKSCEHDISVITACLAKGYFDAELVSVYLDKNNVAYLAGNDWTPRRHLDKKPKNKVVFLTGKSALGVLKGSRLVEIPVDVAVNCCHGLNGEDGCVAALCQLCGIPLVGSDVVSSAIAMDKIITKRMLASLGFDVVNGVDISFDDAESSQALAQLRFPLIVKPALLGSSIGVNIARDAAQLKAAMRRAFDYCPRVLVEEALTDFFEINCAAMRVKGEVVVSNVDEPVTVNDLLTFEDKYIANNAEKKPSDISEGLKKEVCRQTAEIYRKFGFGGVIRVDFLFDKTTNKLYVNEINTTPGSLAFGLWEGRYSRTGYGEALVSEAIADYRELQSFTYVFDSGVLSSSGGVKKK